MSLNNAMKKSGLTTPKTVFPTPGEYKYERVNTNNYNIKYSDSPYKKKILKTVIVGGNDLTPPSDIIPMARNFLAIHYGSPGSGKTTAALVILKNLGLPSIQFTEGVLPDDGSLEIEEYVNDDTWSYNQEEGENSAQLPVLTICVISPTMSFDDKFNSFNLPLTVASSLQEMSELVEQRMHIWSRWWKTSKFLKAFKDNMENTGSPEDVINLVLEMCKISDMRSPEETEDQYNTSALNLLLRRFVYHEEMQDVFAEIYRSITPGQKKRFSFIPMPSLSAQNAPRTVLIKNSLETTIMNAIDEAHRENQSLGLRIKTPFFEDYFVKYKPKSILLVDDQAGEAYFHKNSTSFSNIAQKRRHYQTSLLVTCQYEKALSPMVRSMATEIFVSPNIEKEDMLKSIYKDYFARIFRTKSEFDYVYRQCEEEGKPLCLFKAARQLRSGFTTIIDGINNNNIFRNFFSKKKRRLRL